MVIIWGCDSLVPTTSRRRGCRERALSRQCSVRDWYISLVSEARVAGHGSKIFSAYYSVAYYWRGYKYLCTDGGIFAISHTSKLLAGLPLQCTPRYTVASSSYSAIIRPWGSEAHGISTIGVHMGWSRILLHQLTLYLRQCHRPELSYIHRVSEYTRY